MTELLFISALAFGLGYLCGAVFRKMNPFIIFFGGMVLFIPSAQLLIMEDNYIYTIAFVIGAAYNFGNPLRKIGEYTEGFRLNLMLRRATSKASNRIHQEKEEIEADLYRQKCAAEEELREQERSVKESLRREAEGLERERERFRREKKGQSQGTKKESDTRSYEEILGLKIGFTKEELKKAYRQQCSRLHPDKWETRPKHIQKTMQEEQVKVNEAYEMLKKKV